VTTERAVTFDGCKNGMWVPTGERECIHIGGKSIRIGDDVAGRGDDLLNRANGPPIGIVKCLRRRQRLPRSV
jgi:hypothetical protein